MNTKTFLKVVDVVAALRAHGELVAVSGCGWTWRGCPGLPGRGYYVPAVVFKRSQLDRLVAAGGAEWLVRGPDTRHDKYQTAVEAAVTWQAGAPAAEQRYAGVVVRARRGGGRRAEVVLVPRETQAPNPEQQ
jgi:hypothetical protein